MRESRGRDVRIVCKSVDGRGDVNRVAWRDGVEGSSAVSKERKLTRSDVRRVIVECRDSWMRRALSGQQAFKARLAAWRTADRQSEWEGGALRLNRG